MAKISKLYWIAPDFSKYDYISSLCILYASEKYNKSRLGRLTALVPLLSQSILLVLPVCWSPSSGRSPQPIPPPRPDKTRNKMRVAIESGKGMKVKVVKLC